MTITCCQFVDCTIVLLGLEDDFNLIESSVKEDSVSCLPTRISISKFLSAMRDWHPIRGASDVSNEPHLNNLQLFSLLG